MRRIIDRLYGYDVSPLLWRKIRPRLSAGRVQSVAVRLIVERERQRMAFRRGHLLGPGGHVSPSRAAQTFAGRADLGRRPADSRQPRFRPGHRQAQRRQPAAARRAAGRRVGRATAARPSSAWRRWKTSRTPRGPIRRSPPARCSRRPTASTASPPGARCRWPKACTRTGTSPTCEPTRRTWPPWRSRRPANWSSSQYGQEYLPDAAADLPHQGQERPGSPRSDPPGRPSVRFARRACATSSAPTSSNSTT